MTDTSQADPSAESKSAENPPAGNDDTAKTKRVTRRVKAPEGVRRYTPKEAQAEAARRMAARTPAARKNRTRSK